jgi:AraC family transcriptional regulator
LLELLSLERGSAAMPNATRGGLAAWQVRRVRDFIEDNLTEHVSLAEFARLTRLSPTHFCCAFKRSVGFLPHQYQLRRRVQRAKALIANPSLSVTAIASIAGSASLLRSTRRLD